MKFNNTTLLLILIGVLFFSTISENILEGMENEKTDEKEKEKEKETETEKETKDKKKAIKKKDIPKGDEDLYILKSQAIVPSCPICPEISKASDESTCQPCPPCGRCPEPSFECKKVPNYKRYSNNNFKPLLADFSRFSS
jgi:hypothetical protein